MAETDRLRRALRALADGDRRDGRCRAGGPAESDERAATVERSEYARTLAAASRSLSAVTDAAAFVSNGGQGRLERAIRRAERAGDTEAASEGRRVQRALERLSRAAAGERVKSATDPPADPPPTEARPDRGGGR